jgi:3-deoxy-D-manno-octulosonic-acid transferase
MKLKDWSVRYLYSFLFYLATPFIFLRLLWRSRNAPDYRKRWLERLGFCPYLFNRCIWVHAVSVGETIAAIPLIKELKKRYPDIPLLVTNMTPTGAARVKAAFGDSVMQTYIPYDLPGAVLRFLKRVNPIVAIIMETELWPNLFAICKAHDIPIMIANARLSEKSAQGYQRISLLTRNMLPAINMIAAQAPADAERFIALGMRAERVKVTGNLKFDLEIPHDLVVKSAALRQELGQDRLIWIAASTHQGEEEIVLAAHRLISEKIKNVLLILVPRHPERFDAMNTLAKQQGFQTARRSLKETCVASVNVYLSDTMGELLLMYSVADVAFVGGSFVPVGGHNMLEPAVLSKPILTGPYLFNFAEISAMLFAAEGMLKVENANQLAEAVIAFLSNADYRKKIGENAHHVVEANRGSLVKQVDLAASLF